MNLYQQKILELAQTTNLATVTLKDIAESIDASTPQLVQHHIDQLIKKGFLWIDRRGGEMRLLNQQENSELMRIPIMGAANCGPATQFANDTPEGYLPLAPGLLGLKTGKVYFAVRAMGSSMNQAKVITFGQQKVGIDDGDLVIAEKGNYSDLDKKPYIVAVIDGLANIKKLVLDDHVARLESESTAKYVPIYLEPDQTDFMAGKVVAVVKS